MGHDFAAIRLLQPLLNGGQELQPFRHAREGAIVRKTGKRIRRQFLLTHARKLIRPPDFFNLFGGHPNQTVWVMAKR